MAKDGHIVSEMRGGWRRRAIVALCLFGALLLIFHRPVLLTIGRQLARHYAAKENLRADFRLEGSVFTYLSVRNLHVAPKGRSAVESIDADLVRVDYSLLGLIRHGMSQFLGNVDVRSARVVLNPRNAPEEIHPKKQPERTKQELPAVFPARLRISDATLIVPANREVTTPDCAELVEHCRANVLREQGSRSTRSCVE